MCRLAVTEVGMEPTEQEVFQCLCKDYGSSAAFLEISDRKDLFPNGPKSAETGLRETTKGSIFVTEDKKGKITRVHAFSRFARLCLDYSYNRKCDNHDCTYLHICKGLYNRYRSYGTTRTGRTGRKTMRWNIIRTHTSCE